MAPPPLAALRAYSTRLHAQLQEVQLLTLSLPCGCGPLPVCILEKACMQCPCHISLLDMIHLNFTTFDATYGAWGALLFQDKLFPCLQQPVEMMVLSGVCLSSNERL